MFTRGNSEAAEKALLRAMDIATTLGDHWSQLRLLGRLQIFYERTGNFASSLAWAEQAVGIGDTINEREAIAVAASLAGVSHHLLGNQKLARTELEKSLRYSLPSRRSHTIHYGFDHRNRTGLALARASWLLGHPDQARQWAARVEHEAIELAHPVTHCIALVWILGIYIWIGDLQKAEESLAVFARIAEAHMLGPYIAAALGMRGAIAIRAGNPAQAVGWLEESLARLHDMRYELLTTSFEIALTEGLMLMGRYAEAARQVDGTIEHCRKSGDAFALPELLRIKAATLKALENPDQTAAKALLDEALQLSRQQGALAWELRVIMDVARSLLQQAKAADAQALLSRFRNEIPTGSDNLDHREFDLLWQEVLACMNSSH